MTPVHIFDPANGRTEFQYNGMMDVIDPTRIDPAVMRDLQLLCTRCNSKQRCAQDLDDKPVPASWPKYCPNEPTIEAIKTKSLN